MLACHLLVATLAGLSVHQQLVTTTEDDKIVFTTTVANNFFPALKVSQQGYIRNSISLFTSLSVFEDPIVFNFLLPPNVNFSYGFNK